MLFERSWASLGRSLVTLGASWGALGLLFVTGTGDEGALKIRLRFEDDGTMIVIVDLPEPIVIKMIRVERVEKDEK